MDEFRETLPDLRERVRRNRGDAASLHTLGVMLAGRGEYRRSFICHQAAATCRPANAKYLFHSGSAALALGRISDAAWYLDKALSVDPNFAEAWQTRGRLYRDDFKRPDEALRSYIKAIELAPKDSSNYQAAARCVLNGQGHVEAVACLRDVLPSKLDFLNADRGVASALVETGHYEEAIEVLRALLNLHPGDQASMRVLAELHAGLGDWRTAGCCYEKALAAGNEPAAVISYVLYWSKRGDWDRARELYRSHMRTAHFDSYLGPVAHRWEGQDIGGRTLHLVAGDIYFGDALQYARFARVAKEAGARVILQAPARLRSLLRTVPGVDSVVAPYDRIPPVDYQARAFWMLYALPIPVIDMIGKAPYIQAPADLRTQWRDRIRRTSGINVGIAWRGSPYRVQDRFGNRSMSVENLRPLASIPGITLYSLQCGEGRAELLNAYPPFPAIDLAPDFPNTSAAIEALDLVITIDTSIAHLAGALNKRTFLLLPYDACFRWMVNRDDTPWYPAMRLFRQTRPGEWSDVVTNVAAAVANALKPGASAQ